MPMHDWKRVDAGIFHDFHLTWIGILKNTLNSSLLPPDYYALADQLDRAEKPAGAVLCLERATGKRVWRYDVPDGVHGNLCLDEERVWFAARDRHCYCLERRNGGLLWKTDIGSAVVASPALVGCGESKSLYVAGSSGFMNHLDARTGKLVWAFDVAKDAGRPATLFSSPRVQLRKSGREESRWIWFGCGLSEFTRGILYCLEEHAVEPFGD